MRIGAHPRARWLPAALFLLLFYASSGRLRGSIQALPRALEPRTPRATRFDGGSLPPVEFPRPRLLVHALAPRRIPPFRFRTACYSSTSLRYPDRCLLECRCSNSPRIGNILFVTRGNTRSRLRPLATSPRSIVYVHIHVYRSAGSQPPACTSSAGWHACHRPVDVSRSVARHALVAFFLVISFETGFDET